MKKTCFLFLFALSVLAPTGFSADPKPYPLQSCIVSDEPFDSSRKPFTIVHEGQEVKFCCRECRADFQADPGKFLKKIQPAK